MTGLPTPELEQFFAELEGEKTDAQLFREGELWAAAGSEDFGGWLMALAVMSEFGYRGARW